MIYNKVLTNAEIEKQYNDTKSKFINEKLSIPLTLGLFGYYNFDKNSFEDLIESRNGTMLSSIEFDSNTPSGKGKTVKFNSNSGFITIPKSLWDNIEKISISFWIKTNKTDYQPIFLQGPNRFDGLHTIALNSKSIYIGNTSYCFACPSPVNYFDSKWHLITITCDGINNTKANPNMTLYLDGNLFAISPGSEIMFDENYDLFIGSDGFTVSDCSLDNIRFYNRVLSQAEIKSIYDFEKL